MPLQWLFVREPFGCRHSSNRRRLACESLNIPSPAPVTAVLIKGRFILRQLGARRHKTNCNTISPPPLGSQFANPPPPRWTTEQSISRSISKFWKKFFFSNYLPVLTTPCILHHTSCSRHLAAQNVCFFFVFFSPPLADRIDAFGAVLCSCPCSFL